MPIIAKENNKVKNKSFNLSSRCLAFLLSFLMMLSCFTAVSFASDASENGTSSTPSGSSTVAGDNTSVSQSGTSFTDGVYTVTIDADSIFEMIDNGSVSIESIKDLIPQELLDAITAGGSVSDRVISILRAYINLAIDGIIIKSVVFYIRRGRWQAVDFT